MNPPPAAPAPGEALVPSLRREAGRCVACGLCLPHCPTYRKTSNEADSPRGRIFLAAAVLEGRLPPSARLVAHLDMCLGCRACESACPSQVRYGWLMDGMRAWIAPHREAGAGLATPRRLAGLLALLARPRLLRAAGWALGAYRSSGLQRIARATGMLERLGLAREDALLPPLRPFRPEAGLPSRVAARRGRVALFLGCMAPLTDGETLSAALFLLRRLGYQVSLPTSQGCCGAAHLHNGAVQGGAELAAQNLSAFSGPPLEAILHCASGCAATLREYVPPLGAPVRDISDFLLGAEGWDELTPAPLEQTIAVHEPCSSRNVLHDQGAAYGLLARIPGASILPLAGNDQCCGAAGTYALTQPAMAGLLLRDKISAIQASGARYLATSNPGCALHLAAGLRQQGGGVEVLHPVTLLARQLGYRYA